MNSSFFTNRILVIATKHQKEKVISPILEKELGVKCITLPDFDTDRLGTFTGEIERNGSPLECVRNKANMALALGNYDLAVASEGSFGPHPSIFFVPANEELLVLIDKKNDIEIVVRELSIETNFNAEEINNWNTLKAFADKIQFPSHGIILRSSKNDKGTIIKNINNFTDLQDNFDTLMQQHGTVYAETDMRAMHNPTRMNVIEKAASNLAKKANCKCPQCHTPGFDITDAKRGLRCSWCGAATNTVLSYIYTCKKCSYTKEEMYPSGKQTEDPMYCDICNP